METNIVRIGKVSSVDAQNATVKVFFTDLDDMVSTDLPVLFPQCIQNKAYAMPDVGENVLCLFLGHGVGDGFCIGCFYTQSEIPPVAELDKVHYAFSDGTYFEYDRKEHKLKGEIKGDVELKCTTLKIEVEKDVIIQSGTSITLKGKTLTQVVN